jgi:hypothetical protein
VWPRLPLAPPVASGCRLGAVWSWWAWYNPQFLQLEKLRHREPTPPLQHAHDPTAGWLSLVSLRPLSMLGHSGQAIQEPPGCQLRSCPMFPSTEAHGCPLAASPFVLHFECLLCGVWQCLSLCGGASLNPPLGLSACSEGIHA